MLLLIDCFAARCSCTIDVNTHYLIALSARRTQNLGQYLAQRKLSFACEFKAFGRREIPVGGRIIERRLTAATSILIPSMLCSITHTITSYDGAD